MQTLSGQYVVQLLSAVDVNQPRASRDEEDDDEEDENKYVNRTKSSKSRLLKVLFTDGAQQFFGMELR